MFFQPQLVLLGQRLDFELVLFFDEAIVDRGWLWWLLELLGLLPTNDLASELEVLLLQINDASLLLVDRRLAGLLNTLVVVLLRECLYVQLVVQVITLTTAHR